MNKNLIPSIDQRKNTLPTVLYDLLNSYRLFKDTSDGKESKNIFLPDIDHGYIKIWIEQLKNNQVYFT